jgi:hypothetical protein
MGVFSSRIQFVIHRGKRILVVDFSHCSPIEVAEVARAVPEVVTSLPRDSALILSDYTGAALDHEAMRVLKESAVFDKPYVKKSAWTGEENLPQLFADSMKTFSRREFPAFKTRQEALEWLAAD